MEQGMWLARDKNNILYLFIGRKPQKKERQWINPAAFWIAMPHYLFPEVKWWDDEPTKVKIIIDK